MRLVAGLRQDSAASLPRPNGQCGQRNGHLQVSEHVMTNDYIVSSKI
jgi:hypothetical protein